MGKHLVQVAKDILQELSLRARLDQRDQYLIEISRVHEEENRQNGDKKQYPYFLGSFRDPNADPLGDDYQFLAMVLQNFLHADLRRLTPAALFADVDRDLPRTHFGGQFRPRFAEASRLPGDSRAHKKDQQDEPRQQKQIDHGDRTSTAAQGFLKTFHGRVDQVGKKDGK